MIDIILKSNTMITILATELLNTLLILFLITSLLKKTDDVS
jgi:hypothetical protein